MKYARINLTKTNYNLLSNSQFLHKIDINQLNEIFTQYCRYKKFESVMPIFDNQYNDVNTDIIGYFVEQELVAFTMIRKLDQHNVENCQFAWNYNNPKLGLGIESLKNECAVYKNLGYEYMYLGLADEYKSQLDGYEIVGKL